MSREHANQDNGTIVSESGTRTIPLASGVILTETQSTTTAAYTSRFFLAS